MEERERKGVKPRGERTASGPAGAQPVPEPVPVPEPGSADSGADELNVCSEKFDPLLALYSPAAPPLPFPNIKCFNNVSEYESFLRGGPGRAKPENVEKRRREAAKGVADPERIERLRKLMVNNPASEETPRRRRPKAAKNVLTRMSLCQGSPLGELHRCVEARIRVRVHIRTFKGLRGVCSGFVVAFDKFWNMAMVDVDETYREPLLGEALHHEKALTVSRLFEKLSLQDSSGRGDPVEKRDARDKPSEGQADDPKSTGTREDSRRAGPGLSEKGGVSGKERDPAANQKTYGKVRSRHINQLFVRGENVILVNPQPL